MTNTKTFSPKFSQMFSPALNEIIAEAVPTTTPALQLVVRWRGELLVDQVAGWLDPETKTRPVRRDTQFDMASVTKLFATTAFMHFCEAGLLSLHQPVAEILPEFSGKRPIRPYENPLQSNDFVTVSEQTGEIDAGKITFYDLLTHQSGLPAWRPLFRQADREEARHMALQTFFSYPTGTRIVYSDIGLILLGMAMERVTGERLDQIIHKEIVLPLGLRRTRYYRLPQSKVAVNVAPTELCKWRQRRVAAEVHDENAARLGGVSGHAGLFSTARDVARLGQMFLDNGAPILQPETVTLMRQVHVQFDEVRRGIGFALWSPDPEASSNPFSPATFGHTGFTGTSLWIDPQRQLVVALLTNDVYHGRIDRGIGPLRVKIHREIVDTIDATVGI